METIDSWDKYFFKITNLVALKSKDPSSKVGTVIVKNNRILSTGFNGFCVGIKDSPERYSNRKIKYQLVAHSEFNACIIASRFGISLNDSILYTHSIPCHECAKSIIQSGIKVVKTLKSCNKLWDKYNITWEESCDISNSMLLESGVIIQECDIFCDDLVLIGGKEYKI